MTTLCSDHRLQVMGFKSDVSDVLTAAINNIRAAADQLQGTLHASANALEGALPKSDMCAVLVSSTCGLPVCLRLLM